LVSALVLIGGFLVLSAEDAAYITTLLNGHSWSFGLHVPINGKPSTIEWKDIYNCVQGKRLPPQEAFLSLSPPPLNRRTNDTTLLPTLVRRFSGFFPLDLSGAEAVASEPSAVVPALVSANVACASLG
jgi:hypothetical protein